MTGDRRHETRDLLISVIIPAYNAEQTITRCLQSVSRDAETGERCEILVVDDGSADKTAQKVTEAALTDNRIRLIGQKNAGVSAARNTAMREAKGRYLMFLDADDYLADGAMNRMFRDAENRDADFIAYGWYNRFGDGVAKEDRFPFDEVELTDRNRINHLMYASSHLNTCWAKLFRRSIVEQNRLQFDQDLRIGEDLMFVFRYYECCERLCVLNIPVLYYCINETSAMQTVSIADRFLDLVPQYAYGIRKVSDMGDPVLYREACKYYFRVMTALCRDFCKGRDALNNLRHIYNHYLTGTILKHVQMHTLPVYKWLEYVMMRYRMSHISLVYYMFKRNLAEII